MRDYRDKYIWERELTFYDTRMLAYTHMRFVREIAAIVKEVSQLSLDD